MERLNKLWKEQGPYGLMAITYLLEIGFRKASKLTDKEIQKVKDETPDNSILSGDFNEWIMQTARDIANEVTEVQLLQWVQVNKPYDTKGIKKA